MTLKEMFDFARVCVDLPIIMPSSDIHKFSKVPILM